MANDKSKSIEHNVNRGEKNLNTDHSFVDQPAGTTRFALNAVNETDQGDKSFLSNEESNEICYTLPSNYTLLGSVYIGNGKTAIFSVSLAENASEIGIADDDCNYVTHVNDLSSPDENKLNFKIANQIDATYRLRRGCENTVYFVDGVRYNSNKPRYYNFDKPEQFKTIGEWDSNKFELVRSYREIPTFDTIEVLDSGGVLEPGSYNVSIQYVDEDLNPTEWIVTTEIINIYNDDQSNNYLSVRGSINSDVGYEDFPTTNKAIKVSLSNLDESFLFYRLAFIEASSGSGLVTKVNFTENIPTTKSYFIYSGNNVFSEGTEEEIITFQQIIDKASNIEQIDNMVLLGNVTGKPVDFCRLQQFASKITADMITTKVVLNNMSTGNPKSPTVMMEAAGYMPGEIYSFGVIWVFDDGAVSPTYHIPGKNPTVDSTVIYQDTPDADVYPMNNDNQSTSDIYTDNSSCGTNGYWGVDSEGTPLKNAPVRHHRFPTRSEIGETLISVDDSSTSSSTYFQVRVEATGIIDTPCTVEQVTNDDCDPPGAETEVVANPFEGKIYYTVKGIPSSMIVNINPASYFEYSTTYDLTIEKRSSVLVADSISDIVITKIEESQDPPTVPEDVTAGGISTHGLVWTAEAVEASFTSETKTYSTNMFGIQFSNIEIPSEDYTNGEKIIGYYIVRNDRTEDQKTILDSGILVPSLTNEKYISHGLLGTELTDETRISKRIFGIIHPEHKFNSHKYTQVSSIEQQGVFNITDRKKSKVRYLDVLEGTSYDEELNRGGASFDDDGWSIKAITRDSITNYTSSNLFNKTDADIESIFYLDALESRDIKDENNEVASVYNIAGDNKVGIIELKANYTAGLLNKLPYVYIKRTLSDHYSSFRILPYYKASENMQTDTDTSAIVFGGDTFVTPMRYTNTVFWDNRIAARLGKKTWWMYLAGALIVAIGVVLSIFSFGAASPLIILGIGIAVAGAGALLISSGVKKDALIKAYHEEYEKGLRETALDDWTEQEYVDLTGLYKGGVTNAETPQDDEIQWIGDTVTDLWFESQVNIQLRHGFVLESMPTFMDAPGKIEDGNNEYEIVGDLHGLKFIMDTTLIPVRTVDTHIMNKLVAFDPERDDSRGYLGHSLGEYYEINPDYRRTTGKKIYNHLGIEYDCCSDCQEEFPQRFHWSQQSFQEELSDNYRVFLPNNYKDIEGEKGHITNMYRMQNNLYIHTEEALWHLPQNYQERVTGDIVSFLGTGSYFDVPPRLIVDDSKSSAGTEHKWSAIKTRQGILFVSQRESKIYLFDGNKLKSISDYGMSSWFKSNMQSLNALQFYRDNGTKYPYIDNPSNSIGTGFISTYDTDKERFIITKKDFGLNTDVLPDSDYQICNKDGDTYVLENYQATIDTYVGNGYDYEGVEDCNMKFSRTIYTPTEVEREVITYTPTDADIIVQIDWSASFSASARDQIRLAAKDWQTQYAEANPNWTGNLYFCEIGYDVPIGTGSGPNSERWVKTLEWIKGGVKLYYDTFYPMESDNPLVLPNLLSDNLIAVSFVNENSLPFHYHPVDTFATIPAPESGYGIDYTSFVEAYDAHILGGGTFIGLLYPIVMTSDGFEAWEDDQSLDTNGFLQHAFGAIKGTTYTTEEIANINASPNPFTDKWSTMMTSLANANIYSNVGPGMDTYGWSLVHNRGWDGTGYVITSDQFQQDINTFILGNASTETILVTIQVPSLEFTYVNGVLLVGNLANLDTSWTMSYDIAEQSWISYHSYMPNAYFYVANKFYSWINGNNNIWRHNALNSYQTFYGIKYPHIIEIVSVPAPLLTMIWEYFSFQTEAKQWSESTGTYVDKRNITHDKVMVYNTRQLSGILNMNVKSDTEDMDYLLNQIKNDTTGEILITRTERNWNINDFRDIRVDYDVPMFIERLSSIQSEYYIDKIVNEASIDYEKDWTELESFRDKFLVIRFIFDNFDDVRLITNYSVESESPSPR